MKSSAAEYLFTINESGKKLNTTTAETFHTTVAQAVFLCRRSRIDVQLPVAFLCTRVKEPDEDDWKKLL